MLTSLFNLSKLNKLALGLSMMLAFVLVAPPAVSYAVLEPGGGSGTGGSSDSGGQDSVCGESGTRCTTFVEKYINPFIYLLSGLVGVLAVISIIMAGIQYASSADDPGVVTKAKQRMFNTVIGLVAYIFLYAFFDYLVPGGFFK